MTGFNLSALAVREQAVTLLLLIAIGIAGTLAFLNLGRAEDPSFTVKVLTVTAAWPGATAQQMQDLVAEPLEKRLQELDHYERVETATRPGLAFMTLTFDDSTPPSEVASLFYQARKKMGDEALRLPQGVVGPFVNDEYSDVSFALYSLKARGMPPRQLARQAEILRQRLLQVDGVTKVNIIGERPERIFVDFSVPRLATLGVGARDIFDALQRQNLLTPAGSVSTHGPQIQVRLDGAFGELDAIRETPIAANGRTFRLADIAEVTRGYEDLATFLIRSGGEPSIVLGIVMRKGWNGLTLGKALEAEERAISETLPTGLSLTKISDQSANISEAVGEFMLKFFVALAVVLVVCLVALGWRVGIVVAAAVPLTLAAVFVVMQMTDKVFDRITLGALILSLGLLVDDAIIAIETMVVKMEEGMDRIQAAAFAWSSTAAPMLSGTLVTIIGLMPVGFAQSSSGEYAGNIFWVVGIALIASWLVAVVFTPYLGVKLLPEIKPVPGGHAAIYATPNYQKLRRVVRWAVARKFTVLGAVVGIFVASVGGLALVEQQFFPVSERPELIAEVTLPEGTNIQTTARAAEKVERWLAAQPEAKVVTSYVGQGAPRFFLSLSPELPNSAFAKFIILTPDADARDALKSRLRARIAAGLAPEARVRVTQLLFGPGVPFPVAYHVSGPDIDKLRRIADEVQQAMRTNPNVRGVNQDWGGRITAARFVLDQARLRLIGLSPADAAQQLQFLLSGVPVTQVRNDIRVVEVVARASGPQRLDPERLADLSLTTRDGRTIPLEQIGRMVLTPEDPVLKRRDRRPTITVQTDIDERLQAPDVNAQIEKTLEPIRAALPTGYRIDTAGAVEEAGKANVALAAVFPVMIALMLLVIMIQVRSFAGTGMVILTAPLGIAGAVPALLLFGQPFGFNAILGLIGLAGILMRNTLILIGQIDDNRASGLDGYNSVIEATVQRARPVILTALAAVLAFAPLTTSSFWGPMAYVLIGGTAVGTVLTLVFLPALYAIWFRIVPGADEQRGAAPHAPFPPSSLQPSIA